VAPKDAPTPRLRPTPPQKPKPKPPTPDTSASDIDQITALLDKRKLEQMAAADPAPDAPETVGSTTGSASVARMTANELDLLRARLAQCWSPPLGWTDPSEVRVVLLIELNQDGSVAGTPSVLESPQGAYSTTAPESALRAVRRCAPYALPAEKYDDWKQVKVTFDPRDMGGA
jgi:colicin import membrane protein